MLRSSASCEGLALAISLCAFMSASSFHPRPAVVFVADNRWWSFFQLAAVLRRAGLRTVRVSVGPSIWRPENLLFSRNVFLSATPSPELLANILANEYVVDIQPTESLALTSYEALNLLPASQRSDIWVGRPAIIDKWDLREFLDELGLQSPEALVVAFTPADEAVKQLSLPIIVKRRVGSSGSQVKVFSSLRTLREYVAEIESPTEWLYERFIEGSSFVYAACVNDSGASVIATYEVLKRAHLRGPSSVVEFRDDTALREIGKTLTNALPFRGLICFDTIRDPRGTDWIHDINPRVFGGLAMCQLAGFDFRGAYLQCIGVEGIRPIRLGTTKSIAFGFPEGRRDLLESESLRITWPKTVNWYWRYWRILGTRYFLVFALDRPITAWRRLRDRSRC